MTILNKLQVKPQKMDQWCWAAIAEAISRFYEDAPPKCQCEIVSQQLNEPRCCINQAPKDLCDKQGSLHDALQSLHHLGNITGTNLLKKINIPATAKNVTDETTAGRPMCARIEFPGVGAHVVGIRGFENSPSGQLFLHVCDPFLGHRRVSFDDFSTKRYMGSGQWTNAYFTKKV